MPHEILQQAEIVPLVAQGIAGAVSQHVGPDATKAGTLAGFADEVIDGLARHWLPPLGDEKPRQAVIALREVAFDGAHLVPLSEWGQAWAESYVLALI